jgi:PAS domain S-box-containing protein
VYLVSPLRVLRHDMTPASATFRYALLCVLCFCITQSRASAKPASVPLPKRQQIEVLFLSSLDPDMPDVAAMIEQTERQILVGSDKPARFSFEYLDFSSSVADQTRRKAAASYLTDKYSGQTFQLVIAIGEETVMFAEQMQSKLFPDGSLLFFVVNPQNGSQWLHQKPSITGVIREVNYLPTLQLALLQNPGTSHVIVVSGSSEGEKLDIKIARQQFRAYESNLEFQYLTDLALPDLGPRLASAQPEAVILFLDFATDSSGEQFIPARILPLISRSATRPIYGTFSSVVGNGVVGGSVAELGDVGRILGYDGVQILKGQKPESIPVTHGDFQHYVIDWRQLHRWGFNPSQLPKESEVRYWEYSPWELYRWRILGLSGVLLIETLLIVLLLRSRIKRKRAQDALIRKEKELAEAQRLAKVGNWLWDPASKTITWSEELYRIYGTNPGIPPPKFEDLEHVFTPESMSRLTAVIKQGAQIDSVPEIELEVVRPDGSTKWVSARGEAVRNASGRVTYIRGTAQDITERRRAEAAAAESENRFRLIANTAPVLIWMSGPDKLCSYFNRPWLEFTGRRLEEELGNGWAEGVHAEDLAKRLETYIRNFDRQEKFRMEYRLRRHDGEYRWILDMGTPRYNNDGSFAGYVGCCMDISELRQARATVIEFSGRLIRAGEEERARIARELHDDINQRLALLANRIQECDQSTSAHTNLLQKKELREIWRLTNEIATDIQHMSHQLHPSKLHYLGLAATVRQLCKEFSEQHKIEVECTVKDLPEDLEENVSLNLFRTVQESLRNVFKHSQAHHVKVELSCESNVVQLRVSDDGIGFNPEHIGSTHGLGLISMQERLRSVGGEFSIWSKPSLGTQVQGRVPVNPKPAHKAAEAVAD